MSDKTYEIGLKPVELENANEEQKQILERAKKANGMIPNMYKNMVNLPGLQDTYDLGYKHFREQSGFTPAEQEVVFLTLSIDNDCGYCTAAHSFIADNMSKTPEEVTNAIRDGKEIPDAKMKALSEFTKIMNESRGNPTPEQAKRFLDAGYEEIHILGIILAQSVKTISNYSNHIFHTEIDDAFAGRKLEKA
ncbi:carboxymuconolactone decarboxylase family protein [Pontixanthobacter gangjinensis]|uniref:Carboxymuconolactone decarboxylase family protein n=1 Tax=Christiangramia aestuarii TaxID=1028746 RepID=A0A7K1LNC2_9FLAO|nr:carboxymuconolactone decarboxylase family protein [Christiangramia aestuarii]MUP42305.1 carboxymuconolactone decarboxylase family protein [Christiangramia aestuarii]